MVASRFVVPCLPLVCCVFAACGGDDPAAQTSSSGSPTPDAGEAASSSSSSGATAEGGTSSSGGSSGDASVGPDTVRGAITDSYECGVAGAIVSVEGQIVTTDATGGFQIQGITAPYDLHVVVPAAIRPYEGPTMSQSFVGLHELNPRLVVGANSTACSQATITGTVAATAGYRQTTGVSKYGSYYGPGDSFSMQAVWPSGVTTLDVQVAVLDVTKDGPGFPTAYLGLGRANAFGLVPGGSAIVTPIIHPLDSYDVNVTIPVNTGEYVGQRSLVFPIALGLRGVFGFDSDAEYSGSFSLKVPNDPSLGPVTLQASTRTAANATFHGATVRLDPATPNVVFTFMDPPIVTAPAAGATGFGAGDSVSWMSAGPHCIYSVEVTSNAPKSSQLTLTTTATTAIVPDLAAQGNPVPASQLVNVRVNAECDPTSVEVDERVRATPRRLQHFAGTTIEVTSR